MLFVVLKLLQVRGCNPPTGTGVGVGRSEGPGWDGFEETLERVASHRATASSTLGLQVYLTGSGLCLSRPISHHYPFLSRLLYSVLPLHIPGAMDCAFLLPQVATSLLSHSNFLFSLPPHPKHHPAEQDSVNRNGSSTGQDLTPGRTVLWFLLGNALEEAEPGGSNEHGEVPLGYV